jgi:hypothetical protein
MPWDLRGNSGTNPETDFLGTTDDQPLVIRTNGREALRIPATGGLEVRGGIRSFGGLGLQAFNPNDPTADVHLSWSNDGSNDVPRIRIGGNGPGARNGLDIQTVSDRSLMRIHNDGSIEVPGDVLLTGADCAENFDVEEAQSLEPGMVMVIGDEEKVYQCTQAYDKRVAGVISGAGDYKPGMILGNNQSQNKRLPVALTGKVYCKVDTQYAPIAVGDLLTTSPSPGHAMKASDPLKAFGAILGKALRPLRQGEGLIPILVALQ